MSLGTVLLSMFQNTGWALLAGLNDSRFALIFPLPSLPFTIFDQYIFSFFFRLKCMMIFCYSLFRFVRLCFGYRINWQFQRVYRAHFFPFNTFNMVI